jgi:hypothetical protein
MDMVITHGAITAITVVGIHITERITTVGGLLRPSILQQVSQALLLPLLNHTG